jgi:hypothetical protein
MTNLKDSNFLAFGPAGERLWVVTRNLLPFRSTMHLLTWMQIWKARFGSFLCPVSIPMRGLWKRHFSVDFVEVIGEKKTCLFY